MISSKLLMNSVRVSSLFSERKRYASLDQNNSKMEGRKLLYSETGIQKKAFQPEQRITINGESHVIRRKRDPINGYIVEID